MSEGVKPTILEVERSTTRFLDPPYELRRGENRAREIQSFNVIEILYKS